MVRKCLRIHIIQGGDGSQVFENSYNSRRVCVKRIKLSAEATRAANRVMSTHLQVQNDRSPHIIRFESLDFDSSYIYLSYEPWSCTLAEMIKISVAQATPSLTAVRRDELEKLFAPIGFWLSNGGPSPLFISIMKEMVLAVSSLHRAGHSHGKVTPDCFYVSNKGNRLLTLLGDIGMAQTGDAEGDVYSLGWVLGFCITKFIDIFQPQAVRVLSQFPDLTSDLALHHPVFWSTSRTKLFYERANVLIGGHSRSREPTLRNDLRMCSTRVLGSNPDWLVCLEPDFQDFLRDYPAVIANATNVAYLTTIVRNRLLHCHESTQKLKAIMGQTEDSVLAYFTRRFPKLLVEMYEIISRHFPADAERLRLDFY